MYVSDSGLLHALLGLEDLDALQGHPKVGASWEGFVIREIVTHIGARPGESLFWSTHAGAELDLLIVRGTRKLGFEEEQTTSPAITRSMRSAIQTLGLDSLNVIHAGEYTFDLGDGVRAVAFRQLFDDVSPL